MIGERENKSEGNGDCEESERKEQIDKKIDMNVPSVGDNGTWNATNQK